MPGYALARRVWSPQIAQPRREAKAQQMHEGKDVIGEASRVGVVLLYAQVGLVIEQTIEHVGGITDAHVDGLCVVRCEPITRSRSTLLRRPKSH